MAPTPQSCPPPPPRNSTGARGQEGHLLIGLMILVTIMAILSGVGFQHWSIIERRDREQELMFIQKQYALALVEYQAQQGALPNSLEQLDEMSGQGKRFIRRMWLDPMTQDVEGEDEEGLERWCLIQQGPNQELLNSCPQEGEDEFRLGEESVIRPAQGTGMPIIGVSSRSDEASYMVWNDRARYNEWVYTVQDLETDANLLAVFQ